MVERLANMKKKMKKFEEGGYTGDDEIVKYRMGMIDAKGNDLTKKSNPQDYKDESMGEFTTNLSEPKSVEKTVVKTKVSPSRDFDTTNSSASKPKNNVDRDFDTTDSEKKPFIDIPKRAAGMKQFRSDAESPIERLFKSISGKSQRTTAAEKKMKSGGSVKVSSASKRADGIAQRGKTKGKMC
jgi:hypothetical protein